MTDDQQFHKPQQLFWFTLYSMTKQKRGLRHKLLDSARFRTNEALCQLSYEVPYLGTEGGHNYLLCGTLPQTINSIIMSGIPPKQNAFKFKIAPHKQKSIVKMFFGRKMPLPLANGALCLCTPKHNGKSGTDGGTISYEIGQTTMRSKQNRRFSCSSSPQFSVFSLCLFICLLSVSCSLCLQIVHSTLPLRVSLWCMSKGQTGKYSVLSQFLTK